VKLLFEIEERLGTRILEALFDENQAREASAAAAALGQQTGESTETPARRAAETSPSEDGRNGSHNGRIAGQDERPVEPAARPITHIVATRVTTNGSGDSND
jgi:hypothetical protein